jgi:hypothetical protein
MAFVFDATPKSPTATSLTTVQFADDYFGGELYASEWNTLNNATPADLLTKQQALVKATRRLDRLEYYGVPSDPNQALRHPRLGIEKPDAVAYSYYSADTVIQRVQEACCELALFYLRNDPSQTVDEGLRQFKRVQVTNAVEVEMRDGLPDPDALPAHVGAMLYPFISGGGGVTRLVRA